MPKLKINTSQDYEARKAALGLNTLNPASDIARSWKTDQVTHRNRHALGRRVRPYRRAEK